MTRGSSRAAVLAGLLAGGLLVGCGDASQVAEADKTPSNPGEVKAESTIAPHRYNLGSDVSAQMVAGWDIDVRPDGLGLPAGEGSVEDGEQLYEEKCATCHGVFGEGAGRWPKLAGGEGTLTDARPDKTVGSYWPYASTLFDYIRRAMPFTAPQSLSNTEAYAITAYVLYLNDLVEDDFVLNQSNLASVQMPNKDGFITDDRPDTSNTRCMENCLDASTLVIQTVIPGITPTDGVNGEDNPASAAPAVASVGAEDSAGEKTYQQACQVCHGSGIAGAPAVGDREAWLARLAKGTDLLYQHAVEGFEGESGLMPAKGGHTQLSDQQVKQAVDYMIKHSGK